MPKNRAQNVNSPENSTKESSISTETEIASSNSKEAEMNVDNTSNPAIPPPPVLKEDKKKRKTWVWVVEKVGEQKEEPEELEVNNSGRAKRTSMKKASESISATLTRKPVTATRKKRSGSSQKRETSCATSEATTDRSASISMQQEAGSQEVVSVGKTTQNEAAKTSALEDEEEEIIDVVDEQKPQFMALGNIGDAVKINPDLQVAPNSPDEELIVVDDVQAVATSISTVHIENDGDLITKAQVESGKLKGSNHTKEEISKAVKEALKEKAELDNRNDGGKSSLQNILETQQEEPEIMQNNEQKQVVDKQSDINLDDFTTTMEEEEMITSHMESNTSKEENPMQHPKSAQIPPDQWPQFPQFKKIEENLVLSAEAESKESKSLQCECKPSSKEKKRGQACGSECLNRLLMMECGDECRSGKYCTNRRFQKKEYAQLEVFYTGPKGWGLRAKQDIPSGEFLIEYLGEIIDSEEMARRIRRYGRDLNHKHHYLMALRSGTVIDATTRGNESRFINHSCDPNAATQKWTVGRQLRIGFFAVKPIQAGEEITFNYQFERYGKRAQKCLCESSNCTGFIGASKEDSGLGSGEEDGNDSLDSSFSSDEDDDDEVRARLLDNVQRQRSPTKKLDLFDMAKKRGRPKKNAIELLDGKRRLPHHHHTHHLRGSQEKQERIRPELITDPTLREQAEVNEIIIRGPLRNREQVLEFNRLMVRVDQKESRRRMVDFLLRIDDPNILRLFISNQGFALIRIWFVLPAFERRALQLQSQIARLLMKLPVTKKNQVDEVCIMSTLKQMLTYELPDKIVVKDVLGQLVDEVVFNLDGPETTKPKEAAHQTLIREFETLKSLAAQLAEKWANLVDSEFRIPKKLTKVKSIGREEGKNSRSKHERNSRREMNRRGSSSSLDISNGFGREGFDNDEPQSQHENGFNRPHYFHQHEGLGGRYRRFQRNFRKFLPPHIRRRFPTAGIFPKKQFVPRGVPRDDFKNFEEYSHPLDEKKGQQPEGEKEKEKEKEKVAPTSTYFDPNEPPPTFFNNAFPSTANSTQQAALAAAAMQYFGLIGQYYPSYFPGGYVHPLYFAQQNAAGMGMPMGSPGCMPPPPPPADKPAKTTPNPALGESKCPKDEPMPEETPSNKDDQIKSEMAKMDTSDNRTTPKHSSTRENLKKEPNECSSAKNDNSKGTADRKREKNKSTKEIQTEMLQRRLQSLKASLGSKATPNVWSKSDEAKHSRRDSRSKSRSPDRSRHRHKDYEHGNGNKKKDDHRRDSKDGGSSRADEHRRRDSREESPRHRSRSGTQSGRNQGKGRFNRRGSGRWPTSPDRSGWRKNDHRDRDRNKATTESGKTNRRNQSPKHSKDAKPGQLQPHDKRGSRDGEPSIENKANAPATAGRKSAQDGTVDKFNRSNSSNRDRIRQHLAQMAAESMNNEHKLTPEEQQQRQQEKEKRKVQINVYTQQLKSLVEPNNKKTNESDSTVTYSSSTSSMHNQLQQQNQQRQRTLSGSSVDSTSSLSSSTSSTSSSSTSTSSSSSMEIEEDGEQQGTSQTTMQKVASNSSKIMPNIQTVHLKPFEIIPLNNPTNADANATGVKKGHFLPPKITPMPVPPPTQKATGNRQEQQQCSEDEGDEEEDAEGDGGEMMQPPQVSVNILQDPTLMDAYIHELKEFVYFMETMRRDMHGAPPLPGTFLQHQQQMRIGQMSPMGVLPMRMAAASTKSSNKAKSLKRAHEETTGKEANEPNSHSQEASCSSNSGTIHDSPNIPKKARLDHVEVQQPLPQQHQLVQHEQNFPAAVESQASSSSQHSNNTPPEDPRISNRNEQNSSTNAPTAPPHPQMPQLSLSTAAVITVAQSTTTASTGPQMGAENAMGKCKEEIKTEQSPSYTAPQQMAHQRAAARPLMVSKSGLWFEAIDAEGSTYYYHRDTRESCWELPEGEELIPQPPMLFNNSDAGGSRPQTAQGHPAVEDERQKRRTEFKRQVSSVAAKSIESYRKRFFPSNNDYVGFLRKITHKVLDNQENNRELVFNEQVQKNTRRLVDQYIQHFKNRELGGGIQ